MSALMPKASLAGPACKAHGKAKSLSLPPETLKYISKRIEAPAGAKFSLQALTLGGLGVVEATHQREVRLDRDAKELKGVVAYAPEPVLVGGVGKVAAIFNALPDPSTTEDEVHAFVDTLSSNGTITFQPKSKAKSFVEGNLAKSLEKRSEERRVGKECRDRRLRDH